MTFHPSMAAPVGPVKFWRPGKTPGGRTLGRSGGLPSVLALRPAPWEPADLPAGRTGLGSSGSVPLCRWTLRPRGTRRSACPSGRGSRSDLVRGSASSSLVFLLTAYFVGMEVPDCPRIPWCSPGAPREADTVLLNTQGHRLWSLTARVQILVSVLE